MRILLILLPLLPVLTAQPKLTPRDESEIRAAIADQAKKENAQDSGQIWSERLPITYKVLTVESLSADVALVDTNRLSIGTSIGGQRCTFVMTHTKGRWRVAREIMACPKSGIIPLAAVQRFEGRGSSGCPD